MGLEQNALHKFSKTFPWVAVVTWRSTARLLDRSALFPASAITMFGLACRCSSFTQFFARVNVSLTKTKKQKTQSWIMMTGPGLTRYV